MKRFTKKSPLHGGVFDKESLVKEIDALNTQINVPDLWSDQEAAKALLKKREHLQDTYNEVLAIELAFDEIKDLLEMAQTEGDPEILGEFYDQLIDIGHAINTVHIKALMHGEADEKNAFLEINAGAGGTEAQDWADMLLRMYMRWAEHKDYTIELIAENKGEEAGIKSAVIRIIGPKAYGWLKTESGVHRLVRISPFDANAKRHTSFASVWVYPELDDTISIQIEEKDLRIDTYRASGAGGQHVNRTDSAVRITHLPTHIVVQCQSDRSQHRNKATCMTMLKARLYELEMQKKQETMNTQHAHKKDIGWGSQIRSYVLHPYQLIKDLRTGIEKTNPTAVLDGDIDDFLEAALMPSTD